MEAPPLPHPLRRQKHQIEVKSKSNFITASPRTIQRFFAYATAVKIAAFRSSERTCTQIVPAFDLESQFH